MAALAHPRSGRVCFFETRGLNFGLAGSGVNFVHPPTCITFATRVSHRPHGDTGADGGGSCTPSVGARASSRPEALSSASLARG